MWGKFFNSFVKNIDRDSVDIVNISLNQVKNSSGLNRTFSTSKGILYSPSSPQESSTLWSEISLQRVFVIFKWTKAPQILRFQMSFRKPYIACVLLILSAGTGRSHLCFHCSLNTKDLSCFRKAEGDLSFTLVYELSPKGPCLSCSPLCPRALHSPRCLSRCSIC